MTNPKQEKNVFFDINKLPAEKGLLVVGVSMNRLDHGGENPKDCISFARNFMTKVSKPLVGFNLLYTDFLYLYNEDRPASVMKNSFMNMVIHHKNAFQKIIEQNYMEFQIQNAFNFTVWNQLYVGTNNFSDLFSDLKKIYEKDENFQKFVKEDCESFKVNFDENHINFFLEESLMTYFLTHNKAKINNEFINNHQKWILLCYPGKPPKSMVYLYQLNPFKFSWAENPYQNAWYDLSEKKLIEFDRVDLETYKVK